VVLRTGTPVSVTPHSAGEALASCNEGEIATGGGVEGDNNAFTVNNTFPTGTGDGNPATGWQANAYNVTSSSENLTAYVLCAPGSAT
jgi:hypothetical protein